MSFVYLSMDLIRHYHPPSIPVVPVRRGAECGHGDEEKREERRKNLRRQLQVSPAAVDRGTQGYMIY